ncbi:MAG: hypothetical protein NTZ97_04755 [Candidatus Moranbacteria bacterium]|nr:hypothetical protein [Candidatus Moranbacteria bacterium]
MKNFFVKSFCTASIVIMISALVLVTFFSDKAEIKKYQAKVEIALRHFTLHILSVPHVEITIEAESGNTDVEAREVVLYGVKKMEGFEDLNKLEKLHYDSQSGNLAVILPADKTIIVFINSWGVVFPENSGPPEKEVQNWRTKI